jgi:phosphoribosylanthranilate isomerase
MDPVTGAPRIKICCMAGLDEVGLAIRYGASALGLVSLMPSGPGPIPDDLITELARNIPPGVASFLLTCAQDAETLTGQQRTMGPSALQLVDSVPVRDLVQLREALPGIKLVQAIHVREAASIEEAVSVASYVDAILLDSGNPGLAVKELGGTGRVHDWEISRKIREAVPVPVYLAGGLTPENVAEAIRTVKPFGVDVCSGLRTHGALDESKLARFVAAVHADKVHGTLRAGWETSDSIYPFS